jgi:hypothetical protein
MLGAGKMEYNMAKDYLPGKRIYFYFYSLRKHGDSYDGDWVDGKQTGKGIFK